MCTSALASYVYVRALQSGSWPFAVCAWADIMARTKKFPHVMTADPGIELAAKGGRPKVPKAESMTRDEPKKEEKKEEPKEDAVKQDV